MLNMSTVCSWEQGREQFKRLNTTLHTETLLQNSSVTLLRQQCCIVSHKCTLLLALLLLIYHHILSKKKEETEFLGFYRLQFLSNFFVLFKKALF